MSLRALYRTALALLSICLSPQAGIHRIGLFIGVDRGLESEAALKFASRDAMEMAGIFRQSGLYGADDLVLLTNASLEKIHEAMVAVEKSARLSKKQGSQTYLFLYFSGHGDAESLHINDAKLNRNELMAWLNGLPCDLKIVVLDACESGDFLRSKGGRYLQDIPVQVENNLKSRGSIIISSTSRGELAQESDEYHGAVFTHHLENGLRGLADYNGDGWIGLQEAFEYSRRATSMDNALKGSLHQNPSFDLDLVGASDPGLLPIDNGKSWMLLKHFPTGNLDIYDANSLDRVARVWLSGSDSLAYRIATGGYLFRFHEGGKEFLHSEIVGKSGGVLIDRLNFQEKVRGAWSSKGGATVRLQGIQASFGAPHPFPRMPMRSIGIDLVSRAAGCKGTVSLAFSRGNAQDTATKISSDVKLYSFGVSNVYFLAGSRRLRLSAGVMASFSMVEQELTDNRFLGAEIPAGSETYSARTRLWSRLYQVGAPFEMEWSIAGRFWISGTALYSVYGFKDSGEDGYKFRLELEPLIRFGRHF